MPEAEQHGLLESLGSGNDAQQKLAMSLLALTALACLHFLLYHLHAVFLPFVLGGFIVLALQPSVEITFRFLAGLGRPFRWCGCCCQRRQLGSWDSEDAAHPALWSPRPPTRRPKKQGEAEAEPEKQDEDEEKQPLLCLSARPNGGEANDLVTDILDGLCRGLAVTLVFAVMLSVVALAIFGLCHGAMHLRDTWPSYKDGVRRIERIQKQAADGLRGNTDAAGSGGFREDRNSMEHIVLERMQEYIWELVNYIIHGLPEGLSHLSIMMLYVLFWLYQPLPTGGHAGALVRSYLYKKTLVSVLFGGFVALLFAVLGVDLAILFGMVAFFLNYIPEVGALISILIPIPVILLDGRLQNPALTLLLATIGQLFLKFVFSNILEVKLIERDKEMSIHPVWVIFGLAYFGFIWGPMGMLISVPILAMIKTAAMSARVVFPDDERMPRLAEIFLACLEGRKVQKQEDEDEEPKSPLLPLKLPLQLPPRSSTPKSPRHPKAASRNPSPIHIPARDMPRTRAPAVLALPQAASSSNTTSSV